MGAGLEVQNVVFRSFGLNASKLGVQWIDEVLELTSAEMALRHHLSRFRDVIEGSSDSRFVVSSAVGWVYPSGI